MEFFFSEHHYTGLNTNTLLLTYYRIQRVRLEDVLSDVMSAPRQERCSQARLQIVLICPIFLERVLAHSGRSDCLSALLQPNRMLTLLIGVTDADVTDQHKTGKCRSSCF